MQLTAIVCGFFGTGAKAELYSLTLFHLDGDQVRRYGSLVSTSQTPPARQLEQAGLTREQLEQAPELEQVWGRCGGILPIALSSVPQMKLLSFRVRWNGGGCIPL